MFSLHSSYTNGKAYGSESDYGSDFGQEDPYRNAQQQHQHQQQPSESDYHGNSTLGRRSRH